MAGVLDGAAVLHRARTVERRDVPRAELVEAAPRNSAAGEHGVTADAMLTETSSPHLPMVHQAVMQLVHSSGEIVAALDDRSLPVTADVLAVASDERNGALFDAYFDGSPVRVYVTPAQEGPRSRSTGHSVISIAPCTGCGPP